MAHATLGRVEQFGWPPGVTYQIPSPAGGVRLETFVPWTLVKRGVRQQIITPLDAPQAFQHEAQRERQSRQRVPNTPDRKSVV